MKIIETERLILRGWEDHDLDAFAGINEDAKVMEYFPSTLTREETAASIKRIQTMQAEYGYCFWAAELKEAGELIGFIGLKKVSDDLPFAPAVEIGWRLAYRHWGKGYAPEGAKATLAYGFKELGLDEIVSFTTANNQRSMRVMEKIGMLRDEDGDFYHPSLPKDHPLALHVLYRTKHEKL